MDRQCKKKKQQTIYIWTDSAKNCIQLHCITVYCLIDDIYVFLKPIVQVGLFLLPPKNKNYPIINVNNRLITQLPKIIISDSPSLDYNVIM